MRVGLISEVKNKHPIDSQKKVTKPADTVPDEVNRETCLNCPLKRCKSNCGLLKGDK